MAGSGAEAGAAENAMEVEMRQLKEKIRVLERNNNGEMENNNGKLYCCLVCRVSTISGPCQLQQKKYFIMPEIDFFIPMQSETILILLSDIVLLNFKNNWTKLIVGLGDV